MLIYATLEQIQEALDKANEHFGGNLIFNRGPDKYGKAYRVTLRVEDSKGLGHRLTVSRYYGKQRRLVSACWHAHGRFFDALPEGTRIVVRHQTIYADERWHDYNIGSIMLPCYASEACECE